MSEPPQHGIGGLGIASRLRLPVIERLLQLGRRKRSSAIVPKRNWKLICAASIMSVINLANSSLFTSLLTGGLLFLIGLCAIAPLQAADRTQSTPR